MEPSCDTALDALAKELLAGLDPDRTVTLESGSDDLGDEATSPRLTADALRKTFALPLAAAARELGCSKTSLKKLHRRLFRARWPQRRLAKLFGVLDAIDRPEVVAVFRKHAGCDVDPGAAVRTELMEVTADPRRRSPGWLDAVAQVTYRRRHEENRAPEHGRARRRL